MKCVPSRKCCLLRVRWTKALHPPSCPHLIQSKTTTFPRGILGMQCVPSPGGHVAAAVGAREWDLEERDPRQLSIRAPGHTGGESCLCRALVKILGWATPPSTLRNRYKNSHPPPGPQPLSGTGGQAPPPSTCTGQHAQPYFFEMKTGEKSVHICIHTLTHTSRKTKTHINPTPLKQKREGPC